MARGPDAPPPSRSTPPGLYDRAEKATISPIEVIAAALSGLWLLGCVVFFVIIAPNTSSGLNGLTFVMTAMAVFFPVAMIWVAATAARASRVMREESARLQTAIEAIRKAYITQSQNNPGEPTITKKLDEIAITTRKAEAALAAFTSSRPRLEPEPKAPAPEAEVNDDQPALALGTQVEEITPPLASDDFIRALNFPETAEDGVGFAALRRALKDRQTSQLVQASQDVLTLLSQDGIYMDDLRPDLARPDVWRAFATGIRGKEVAPLGGIRDRSSLALTNGRMKQDPIFRDTALHFMRVFDKVFSGFVERATDAEIQAFGNTRTARAFMLVGRVAGTFD